MSADNWAICPRCQRDHAKTIEAAQEKARAAYGTLPVEEYERLAVEAQVIAKSEVERTFREDYEIYGAEDGTIIVSYSGHCQNCNLGLDFKDERPFFPEAD